MSNAPAARTTIPSAKPLNRVQALVDWRVIYSNTGGVVRNLLEILPRMSEQFEVPVGFLCRARKNEPPKVSHGFSAALPFPLSLLPEMPLKEACWARRLRTLENTVFFSPYYSICPAPLPTVAVIHDLITEIFPELSPGPHFDYVRATKAKLIRSATRLIAVSQSTKNDIVQRFGISPDRIDYVPHGVDSAFFAQTPSSTELDSLRARLPSAPFLLIVGGREAHKNFLRFLDAYTGSSLMQDFHVVVTGDVWGTQELVRLKDPELAKRLHNVGRIDDVALRTLYHLAAAVVYPSYYEGFGLPAIEALAAGTPLAVSRASSLPEVAGDAGFYFDPHDVTEMAKQIRNATDAGRASAQVKNGQARARQFTWDETARLTALSCEKALTR